MREESHLEDMRAAIRGDFARLAERRGEQELMHAPETQPSQGTAPAPVTDLEVEPRRSWLARLISS